MRVMAAATAEAVPEILVAKIRSRTRTSTRWASDEGADGGARARHLRVGVQDVGLIEGEGLGDFDTAGGVLEGE